MKVGELELSGIKRVVEGAAHWERYPHRWVKYIADRAITGMSEQEMHEYLDDKVYDCVLKHGKKIYRKYRIEAHGECINIRKNKNV